MSLNTREHAIPTLFNGEKIPPKLPLSMGGSRTPSNTWLLRPTATHTPNAISVEPAISSGLTLHYPYTLLWDGLFPTPKLPFPLGGSGPPSNTWLLWPTPPHMPNGISIGLAVLQDTSSLHHRQTDKTDTDHGNVSSNRPHLYAMHIRCSLKSPQQQTFTTDNRKAVVLDNVTLNTNPNSPAARTSALSSGD